MPPVLHGPPTVASGPAVVSGAWQLWNDPLHPLFAELPAWHVLRAEALPRLSPLTLTVALLTAEVRERGLARNRSSTASSMRPFALLLRQVVAELGRSGQGFSHALADPRVRRRWN